MVQHHLKQIGVLGAGFAIRRNSNFLYSTLFSYG